MTEVHFTELRGRDLRLAAGGLLLAGALWRVSPVHPPLACPLRTLTGIPCPFCGMTRAVVAGMHGDLVASLRFNPAGVLVIALAIFAVVSGRLPRYRIPLWIAIAFFVVLWAYNITLNPTF